MRGDRIGPPEVHRTSISGIPAIWVDAPPPHGVQLYFRVGSWDETILNRGITHLAEHCALYPLRHHDVESNGQVEGQFTVVWASGSPSEVSTFLSDFARSVQDLPLDRLTTEAGVLRAEGLTRQATYHDYILSVLFGPHGPGLQIEPERSLWRTSARQLVEWTAKHFTGENALLAISGQPGHELALDLPSGSRIEFALPDERFGYRPNGMERLDFQAQGISLGGLAPRSTALVVALSILHERLTETLRHQMGIVYAPATSYAPLDRETAYVFLGADSKPTDLRDLNWHFMDTIQEFADSGPAESEVTRAARRTLSALEIDRGTLARAELARAARDYLLGSDPFGWSDYESELEALKPSDVQRAWSQLLETSLLVPPLGAEVYCRALQPAADEPVDGVKFRPSKSSEITDLRIGETGISIQYKDQWTTVLWEKAILAERRSPSVWHFVNERGRYIRIDADEFVRTKKVLETVLQWVPADIIDRRADA